MQYAGRELLYGEETSCAALLFFENNPKNYREYKQKWINKYVKNGKNDFRVWKNIDKSFV